MYENNSLALHHQIVIPNAKKVSARKPSCQNCGAFDTQKKHILMANVIKDPENASSDYVLLRLFSFQRQLKSKVLRVSKAGDKIEDKQCISYLYLNYSKSLNIYIIIISIRNKSCCTKILEAGTLSPLAKWKSDDAEILNACLDDSAGCLYLSTSSVSSAYIPTHCFEVEVASISKIKSDCMQVEAKGKLSPHENERIESVCLSSHEIFGISLDSILVWEKSTHDILKAFTGLHMRMTSACITSCGKWLLTGDSDGCLKVWNIGMSSLKEFTLEHQKPLMYERKQMEDDDRSYSKYLRDPITQIITSSSFFALSDSIQTVSVFTCTSRGNVFHLKLQPTKSNAIASFGLKLLGLCGGGGLNNKTNPILIPISLYNGNFQEELLLLSYGAVISIYRILAQCYVLLKKMPSKVTSIYSSEASNIGLVKEENNNSTIVVLCEKTTTNYYSISRNNSNHYSPISIKQFSYNNKIISMSIDFNLVFIGFSDGTLKVFSLHGDTSGCYNNPRYELSGIVDDQVSSICCCSQKRTIIVAAGTVEGVLATWKIRKEIELKQTTDFVSLSTKWSGHSTCIMKVKFTMLEENINLLSIGDDGAIKFWRSVGSVQHMVGYVGHRDAKLNIANAVTSTLIFPLKLKTTTKEVKTIDWVICCGFENGLLKIWSMQGILYPSKSVPWPSSHHHHRNRITSIHTVKSNVFIACSSYFVTTSLDTKVLVWYFSGQTISLQDEIAMANPIIDSLMIDDQLLVASKDEILIIETHTIDNRNFPFVNNDGDIHNSNESYQVDIAKKPHALSMEVFMTSPSHQIFDDFDHTNKKIHHIQVDIKEDNKPMDVLLDSTKSNNNDEEETSNSKIIVNNRSKFTKDFEKEELSIEDSIHKFLQSQQFSNTNSNNAVSKIKCSDLRRIYKIWQPYKIIAAKLFTDYISRHHYKLNSDLDVKLTAEALKEIDNATKMMTTKRKEVMEYKNMHTCKSVVSYNSMGERKVELINLAQEKSQIDKSGLKSRKVHIRKSISSPTINLVKASTSGKDKITTFTMIPHEFERFWSKGYCFCPMNVNAVEFSSEENICKNCQRTFHDTPVLPKSKKSSLVYLLHDIVNLYEILANTDLKERCIFQQVYDYFFVKFGVQEVAESKILRFIGLLRRHHTNSDFEIISSFAKFLGIFGENSFVDEFVYTLHVDFYQWLREHNLLLLPDMSISRSQRIDLEIVETKCIVECCFAVLQYPRVTLSFLTKIHSVYSQKKRTYYRIDRVLEDLIYEWKVSQADLANATDFLFGFKDSIEDSNSLEKYQFLEKLFHMFVYYDQKRSGCLTIDNFSKVLRQYPNGESSEMNILVKEIESIRIAERYLNLEEKNEACYLDFWALIYVVLQKTGIIIPFEELMNYVTGYKLFITPELQENINTYVQNISLINWEKDLSENVSGSMQKSLLGKCVIHSNLDLSKMSSSGLLAQRKLSIEDEEQTLLDYSLSVTKPLTSCYNLKPTKKRKVIQESSKSEWIYSDTPSMQTKSPATISQFSVSIRGLYDQQNQFTSTDEMKYKKFWKHDIDEFLMHQSKRLDTLNRLNSEREDPSYSNVLIRFPDVRPNRKTVKYTTIQEVQALKKANNEHNIVPFSKSNVDVRVNPISQLGEVMPSEFMKLPSPLLRSTSSLPSLGSIKDINGSSIENQRKSIAEIKLPQLVESITDEKRSVLQRLSSSDNIKFCAKYNQMDENLNTNVFTQAKTYSSDEDVSKGASDCANDELDLAKYVTGVVEEETNIEKDDDASISAEAYHVKAVDSDENAIDLNNCLGFEQSSKSEFLNNAVLSPLVSTDYESKSSISSNNSTTSANSDIESDLDDQATLKNVNSQTYYNDSIIETKGYASEVGIHEDISDNFIELNSETKEQSGIVRELIDHVEQIQGSDDNNDIEVSKGDMESPDSFLEEELSKPESQIVEVDEIEDDQHPQCVEVCEGSAVIAVESDEDDVNEFENQQNETPSNEPSDVLLDSSKGLLPMNSCIVFDEIYFEILSNIIDEFSVAILSSQVAEYNTVIAAKKSAENPIAIDNNRLDLQPDVASTTSYMESKSTVKDDAIYSFKFGSQPIFHTQSTRKSACSHTGISSDIKEEMDADSDSNSLSSNDDENLSDFDRIKNDDQMRKARLRYVRQAVFFPDDEPSKDRTVTLDIKNPSSPQKWLNLFEKCEQESGLVITTGESNLASGAVSTSKRNRYMTLLENRILDMHETDTNLTYYSNQSLAEIINQREAPHILQYGLEVVGKLENRNSVLHFTFEEENDKPYPILTLTMVCLQGQAILKACQENKSRRRNMHNKEDSLLDFHWQTDSKFETKQRVIMYPNDPRERRKASICKKNRKYHVLVESQSSNCTFELYLMGSGHAIQESETINNVENLIQKFNTLYNTNHYYNKNVILPDLNSSDIDEKLNDDNIDELEHVDSRKELFEWNRESTDIDSTIQFQNLLEKCSSFEVEGNLPEVEPVPNDIAKNESESQPKVIQAVDFHDELRTSHAKKLAKLVVKKKPSNGAKNNHSKLTKSPAPIAYWMNKKVSKKLLK